MMKLILIFISLNVMASVKKPEVFTEQIKSKDVQKKLVFPGTVRSQKQSLILAENSGVVTRLKKQLGYSVKKNEVIGYIENPDPVYQFKPMPIRSPIAGMITDMRFFEGSQVEKGTHIITITDPKSLVVEVQVPAKDISSLKIGGPAEFIVGEKLAVKISDRAQRTRYELAPSKGAICCRHWTLKGPQTYSVAQLPLAALLVPGF